MSAWRFLRRGLAYFRGSYVGMILASAVGAMVLVGALGAGDSVKGSLKRIAAERLGGVGSIFTGGDRFFRAALADEVGGAPVLLLRGQVSARNGAAASGGVQVVGVDPRFWGLSPSGGGPGLGEGELGVNARLAGALGLSDGDTIVLRMAKPGLFSRDAPLSGEDDELVTLRGRAKPVDDEDFGQFSLEASQITPSTVFVPLAWLQEEVGFPGRANMLLLGKGSEVDPADLQQAMTLEDYGMSAVEVPLAGSVELRSERIFLDEHLVEVVRDWMPEAEPVVTYLATTIAANGRQTPYSMVTAVDHAAAPFLPEELAADGIVLNDWEADDLQAGPGDTVTVDFWKAGRGGRLEEASAEFRVAGVVPLEGLAGDRMWMPDFPGVAEMEDSSDWTPGMPIDFERLREKDETYWDDHRGTPKGFIPLERGRELWSNRWGEFTALRIRGGDIDEIRDELPRRVDPAKVGLVLRDVGEEASEAARSPVDIAGLFLSMSLFLIVAAVALVALLFRFHLDLRKREDGLLAALGIPAKRVKRWRLVESLVVTAAGALLGIPLAVGFTWLLLRMLQRIWGSAFDFQLTPASIAIGTTSFVVLVLAAVAWTLRGRERRSVGIRLEEDLEAAPKPPGRKSLVAIIVSLVVAAGAVAGSSAMGAQGAFFLAGAGLLVAGLLVHRRALARAALRGGSLNVDRLARLNAARRPSRTGVVVGILACGVFLVVSVAAFRKGGVEDWRERSSGTGGYALWIETASPVMPIGDDPWLDLPEDATKPGAVLPVRVGSGADASCFNLNQVAQPQLLGVHTATLADRASFTIGKTLEGVEADWSVLSEGEVMRAFVDLTTLQWALKRKLGDRLSYRDDRGREFEVEIAGTLADSVFQGRLLVDEERFLERYPSSDGYRLFLAEANGDPGELASAWSRQWRDRGAEVMTTSDRLKQFHEVENSYIAIFHLLGGLGVVLASAGLGMTTARNLSERRGEFELMRTLGVPQRVRGGLVFREVRSCIGWGLAIGLVAAAVSIVPNLAPADWPKALGWMAVFSVATALAAWAWAWLGYRRMRVGGEGGSVVSKEG